MERRTFITAAPLVLGLPLAMGRVGRPVRFGLIADLHHGLAPDALWRLESFVDACTARKLDFVIQLGDFCYAKPSSDECVRMFERIEPARYHVLGNHDMDFGTKDDVMHLWGMPRRHDSFDVGGVHFVVLDLNNLNIDGKRVPYADSNFYVDPSQRAWADPEQLAWLKKDLAQTELPSVVFSHQPLGFVDREGALAPCQAEVLDVLRESGKVVACVCGHMHVDRHVKHEGMHCVCINSASYLWSRGMRAYKDPLFAFATIEGDTMSIEGVRSRFEHAADAEAFAPRHVEGFCAEISDRMLTLPGE